jgi:hypothetical protein
MENLKKTGVVRDRVGGPDAKDCHIILTHPRDEDDL